MIQRRASFLRFVKCSSGNSLLEAAIVLPLAIALMVGIVDFGLAFRTKAIAEKSMQNAARYLSTLPQSAVCGWGWTNAKNLAVTGNLAAVSASNPPLIANWSTDNIHWTSAATCSGPPADIDNIDIYADVSYTPIAWRTAITMTAHHQERWIGQ